MPADGCLVIQPEGLLLRLMHAVTCHIPGHGDCSVELQSDMQSQQVIGPESLLLLRHSFLLHAHILTKKAANKSTT